MRTHALGSDGAGAEHIIVPAGGVARPTTPATLDAGEYNVKINGREVFKFATRIMGTALGEVLDRAGCSIADVDLFIPHQANARIIQYAASEHDLPPEKVVMDECGSVRKHLSGQHPARPLRSPERGTASCTPLSILLRKSLRAGGGEAVNPLYSKHCRKASRSIAG
jgi:hypothetical protein